MVLIACFIWICNLLKPIKFISSTRLFVLVLLMKAEYRLSYNLISDWSIILVVFLWFHNIFLFSTGYWHVILEWYWCFWILQACILSSHNYLLHSCIFCFCFVVVIVIVIVVVVVVFFFFFLFYGYDTAYNVFLISAEGCIQRSWLLRTQNLFESPYTLLFSL